MTKLSVFSPLVATSLLFLSSSQNGHAETTAVEAPAKPAPKSVLRAAPIKDHWDANAWDPAGGSLFWHAVSDQRRSEGAASGRNTRRPSVEPSPHRPRPKGGDSRG